MAIIDQSRYKSKILAALLAVLIGSVKIGLSQSTVIKAGIHRNDQMRLGGMVAVEAPIGDRLSFQIEGAYARRTKGLSGFSAWNGFHLAFDGRAYLFLRQQQKLCGFYAGLFLAYGTGLWHIKGYKGHATSFSSTPVGLGIGFQQALGERLRLDGGVRLGYRNGLLRRTFDSEGHLTEKMLFDYHYSGYAYLQLGYSF